MIFSSPTDIALKLGSLTIYWYGIFLAVAFFVSFQISLLFVKQKYFEKREEILKNVYDLVFYLIIFGIIGARIYYVILNLDYYLSNPFEIIMINHGGLSIHGGIIGAIIAAIIYTKVKKLDFYKYADIFAIGLPIGQAIGRWGNFFNSEAFGKPTEGFFKVLIPLEKRPLEYFEYQYFHPTFFYEFLWNLLVFCILYFVIKKYFSEKKGVIFSSYLILYSIGRIFIEFLRVDSVMYICGISIAVWVSLFIIIFASILLVYKIKTN